MNYCLLVSYNLSNIQLWGKGVISNTCLTIYSSMLYIITIKSLDQHLLSLESKFSYVSTINCWIGAFIVKHLIQITDYQMTIHSLDYTSIPVASFSLISTLIILVKYKIYSISRWCPYSQDCWQIICHQHSEFRS